MSKLRVYRDDAPDTPIVEHTLGADIALELEGPEVLFSRWEADCELPADASNDDIIGAYRAQIDVLMTRYGFHAVDVVNVTPTHPDKDALRQKFLSEHTHSDYEVRFFVEGSGQFYIHHADRVYMILCEAGDLLSIPANMTHWFDMGPNPSFKCIRLFTTPEGWVANFTGSDIAEHFPRLVN